MARLEDHPIAALFPLMVDDEAAALAESIRANGFDPAHPIWLFEGKILDGRNRYRACQVAGVEPITRPWQGDDPWAFVWRENATRRHLEAGQKVALQIRFLRGSEDWVEARRKAQAEANAARARAIKAQSRATDGTVGTRSAGHVSRDTRPASPAPRLAHVVTVDLDDDGDEEEAAPPPAKPKAPAEKPAWERTAVAAAAGVSPATAGRALALEKKAPDLFEKVAQGELTLPKALGEAKLRDKYALADELRAKPLPMPTGPFDVIVIDPPWRYEARAEDTTHRGRNPYPDMSIEEICALPVGKLASDDAILWLWTTNAFMRQAYQCLDAWGFRERTILTWVKDRMGTGDWLRGKTEHAILAVRGKPLVQLTNQTTALAAALREHSRKPEEFYALVEALCPGTKVEMFAREPREGWARWGAETEKFHAA
jgi:N6-adenosine-specific RNA methylase IME4